MTHRLLTAGLLLAALAWCGRTAAKPPDLPLEDKDVLAPQDPLAPAEAVAPSQPNPFPQAAEPAAPAAETPSFFQMRPSARRMMESCLLFGVHPLLTLTPTADYLDFDEDDEAPVPAVYLEPATHMEEAPHGALIFGIGVNSDAGLTGSIEMKPAGFGAVECGELLKACWQLIPQLVGLSQPQEEVQTGFHLEQPDDYAPETPIQPEPILAPKEAPPNDSIESVCPWMRQQHGASCQEIPSADELSHDVLHNLEMLSQAQTLLQTARDFGRSGRVGEALGCLELAHDLCPGSRIDDAVQEAAVYLFAPLYYGSSSYEFGAEEESEPAAASPKSEEGCEQCPGCGGLSLCKGRSAKECEIELKLAQPVSVDFHAAPLREVIDDLRSWQNINIYVDRAALEADEVSLDRPISVKVENVSLKSALKLVLKEAHLTYVVKDEVLQVTTERAARGKMQCIVYAVADLLEDNLHYPGAPVGTGKTSPEEALMKLIRSTICPQEWCEMGGPDTMDFHPLTRSLVVNATADVQEQIVDLLNALHHRIDPGEEEERQSVGPCEGCKALLNACHEAMDAGRQREAAALAAKAYALDPDQAAADPLVYKMHLVGDDAEPAPITPCLPPVDPETPAALDQLYQESLRSAPADGEEQEPPTAAPQAPSSSASAWTAACRCSAS